MQHLFLALSNPRDGRQQEFHSWYDAFHLQDVVNLCPGFSRGHRYWAAEAQGPDRPRWSSLALYDLEADDVARLHRDVSANAHRFTPSNGVFDDDHVAWVYSPIASAEPLIDVWPGPTNDRLLLAFHDALHAGIDALPPALASQTLERHPDQRGGILPPWRYLTIMRLDRDRAPVLAAEYRAGHQPIAAWLFEGRGRGIAGNRSAA